MYPNKTTRRNRIALPDDPHSRTVSHQTLADQPVRVLRLLPLIWRA